MSELLKAMLDEQAAAVAFRPPDLDTITRTGGLRIRRRRVVTVLASVAAVALVVSAAVVLSGPASRRPDSAAAGRIDPWRTDAVSWALGSTIHHGGDSVEAGHDVRAYVQTSVGFVILDDDDNVYSVTRHGVTRIGGAAPARTEQDHVRLVSDPRGTLAGWVGRDSSGPVLQVHDQATGRTRRYETGNAAAPGDAVFFAIDGRTAYWRLATRSGVSAVDLDTGDERLLASGDQARYFAIWSVENGVLAFSRDQRPRSNVTSIRVGRSVGDSREFTFGESTEADDEIRLSPTGAWLSYLQYEFNGPPKNDDVRAFTTQVRDASTGTRIALSLPPGAWAFPVGWLDDTTLQVLGAGAAPGMYTCAIPEGGCDLAAELPAAALDGSNLVLPGGVWRQT